MLFSQLGLFLGSLLVSTSNAEYTWGTAHSAVVDLDAESFPQAIKDPANPLWLLKFYAPWCGHCKKMAPVLDRVAPTLQGKMAIGKIDCTQHKSLCNEFKVRGYPTIKYAIDGDVEDYPMGRDEASITKFANKMSSPPLIPVNTYQDAMDYAKTSSDEGVIFLGFDNSEENSKFRQTFQKVARKKKASGHFLWLEPPADDESFKTTKSFVKRIETDVKVRILEDVENVSEEKLTEWFNTQNVPLVSMISGNNFQKLGKKGRPLCLGVADSSNSDQVQQIKTHMIQYVSTSENSNYYFGIMDGKKFNRFLEQFNVQEGENPQFLVLDVPTKKYWQNATYSNLPDFIKAIDDGEISPATASKPTGNGVLAKMEHVFMHYFPYSIGVILAFVFGVVFLLIPPYDDHPDYDDGRIHELMEEMEGTAGDKPSLQNRTQQQAPPAEPKKEK